MENALSEVNLLILELGEVGCQAVDDALGEYVEDELCEGARERIDEHLSRCSSCRDGLRLYQEVIDIAGTLRGSFESELEPIQGAESQASSGELPLEVRQRLKLALNTRLGIKLSIPTS